MAYGAHDLKIYDFAGLTGRVKNYYNLSFVFGSLAQLVEQRTFNPLVACSSHARPTKIDTRMVIRHAGFFMGDWFVATDRLGGEVSVHRLCCLSFDDT
jgi:hypothetical protein